MIHDQVYQKTIDSMMTSELRDRTMLYQRSLEIEQRLESVLQIIRRGGYSTPSIANELGVSVPTISRAVCALRERGNRIRAEKQADGWCYRLEESE
ncbi:MAG TPA: HTH domain-containing protein [Planctomycetaceae bacterium]|jgi:transposase|nr:HTH domain-containing protein [Planctomycetaceae bacterium]